MSGEDQGNEIRVGETHVIDWLPAYALNILTQRKMALKPNTWQIVPPARLSCASTRLWSMSCVGLWRRLRLVPAQRSLMKEIHSARSKRWPFPNPPVWQRWAAFFRRSTPTWGVALIIVA